MSDTPRTDEAVRASKGQWSFELRELCQNLERELAEMAEQCQSWADSSRAWKVRADKNWRELEQKKAILDSLRALVTTDHESKEAFIGRVNFTLNQP